MRRVGATEAVNSDVAIGAVHAPVTLVWECVRMASNTINTTRTIQHTGPPEAARSAMTEAMVGRKGKILDGGDGYLSAKFGSQVMLRIAGGWLMPTKFFPVKAHASFTETSDGTEITLTVADAMGVGTKAGMKAKYERAVIEVAGDLVMALT